MNDKLVSDRDLVLVYQGTSPKTVPTLTCELWVKWYSLYLVHPDGSVSKINPPIDDLEDFNWDDESVVGDHCWNPKVLGRYAEAQGWEIDDLSFDVIAGRWHNTMGNT